MLSEEYFMYAEDVDLCFRMTRAGYRNYFVGETAVVHYGGGSSEPQSATVMKWKSVLQYFLIHHGSAYAMAFRFVMIVVAIGRLTVMALLTPLERTGACERVEYSSWSKWATILRTLVEVRLPEGARR